MNELYHHGIKGQKWGVRRYQNTDGSLTGAGKAHYGIGDSVKKAGSSVGKYLKEKAQKSWELHKVNALMRKNPKRLTNEEQKIVNERLRLQDEGSRLKKQIEDRKEKEESFASRLAKDVVRTTVMNAVQNANNIKYKDMEKEWKDRNEPEPGHDALDKYVKQEQLKQRYIAVEEFKKKNRAVYDQYFND